jgi:FkbM family methyltransferase
MKKLSLNDLVTHPCFQKLLPAQSFKEQALGFIDVGARGGAHELVEPLAAMTAVLGFEPDEDEYQRMLQDQAIVKNWADFALEPIALADKAADATLYLLSAPTNHSLRRPNTGFTHRYNMVKWEEVGTWPLKTELLDTLLFGKRAKETYWGEFIKLDTQGTEYEILQGAERMLKERTVALVTEVAFSELYKGQKLFSEVEIFLRNLGFTFYGFHTIHSRSLKQLDKQKQMGIERAMYADAVFFKDPLPGSVYNQPLSLRQNYVLFTCALLLQYYDFALELAAKTWAADSLEQLQYVKQLIAELADVSHEQTIDEIIQLAKNAQNRPEKANIYAGKFADKRRVYFDYDDILSF